MARLELVAATKEARAPRVRTSAKTVRPHVAPIPAPVAANEDQQKDHFITRNGLTYACSHLIIDLWEAEGRGDRDRIEQALIDAVKEAGATLLHIHLHTFTDGGGISGVAVLAESHISIHTRPKKRNTTKDENKNNNTQPHKAMDVFKRAFKSRPHRGRRTQARRPLT